MQRRCTYGFCELPDSTKCFWCIVRILWCVCVCGVCVCGVCACVCDLSLIFSPYPFQFSWIWLLFTLNRFYQLLVATCMLICLLTFPIISHNLAKKVVKDAIGCHLLLDTHPHRSVQGCCCIQGLLWRTRGNLLRCDYSLFYGIFPLPYCRVLLAKTSETIIIQTISVLFCVYDIGV